MSEVTDSDSIDKQVEKKDAHRALRVLGVCMAAGFASLVVYGVHRWDPALSTSIVGVGALVAGSALLVGGLLGFLFGIPRSLQNGVSDLQSQAEPCSTQASSTAPVWGYRANTNLEQISDWLTKILIGVGLTQLTAIPGKLDQLTKYVAPGLGGGTSSQTVGLALIVFFSATGFLFGYLWTRLFLATAFRQADLSAVGLLSSKVEQVTRQAAAAEKKVNTIESQSGKDGEALNAAYRQLDPDAPAISQLALSAKIGAASPMVRVQIFNHAKDMRSRTWQEDKAAMERTIPIFKALIESDHESRFHRNHGQLGYALKDQTEPDWAASEAELTKAIEIRGPWHSSGRLYYEFNRAVCRIMQDERFLANKPSEANVAAEIRSDLHAAAHSHIINLITTNVVTSNWLLKNGFDAEEIQGLAVDDLG